MLQDDIVFLIFDKQENVEISDIPISLEAVVHVELENIPSSLLGRNVIRLPIGFLKGVYGSKKTFGETSLVITNTISTSGDKPEGVPYRETSVAEISLAAHGTPITRTDHIIKLRARTTTGSTGVLKVELYEGATLRSGTTPLTTPALTNSLVEYSLPISNEAAATITDYSNLSVKFWGYDSAGNALTFDVADISLELPPSTVKQTSAAQISLASHGTPATRTEHSIKLRARTTTGSSGVLKVELYEGATLRSGPLTTSLLASTFGDYSLIISDEDAATITDYSNLSIKFWGYDSSGNSLTFEVADVYLELPPSTSDQTSVAEISLASHGTPATRTNHSLKIRARTTTGSTGVLRAALYEGTTNRSGDLTTSPLSNSLANYTLTISDAAAAQISSYSNLSIRFWGYDSSGSSLTFEVANVYLELPSA